MFRILLSIFALVITTSCQSNNKKGEEVLTKPAKEIKKGIVKLSQEDLDQYETAYFASGCFWCVEAIFESVKGVRKLSPGIPEVQEKNPTYEEVAAGKTDRAEAVKVYYDPKTISFTALVQVFFGSHDPTTLNRQGPDRGPQYRSIAFYKNEKEKKVIESYMRALEDNDVYQGRAITTQVVEFTKFYDAEDYHQDYERKHPNNSYIRNVSIPRFNRFKENFPDYLKEDLNH